MYTESADFVNRSLRSFCKSKLNKNFVPAKESNMTDPNFSN
jgi:hypothetical protein